MNYNILKSSNVWALAPALQSIVAARNGPANCDRFELEDTVLRAGGFAWDIGAEAAPLHAEIARLTEAKREADEAEAARLAALPPPVPVAVTPYQMRRALNQLGLRATVEAAVTSNADARDAWEYALEIRRDNALLAGLAGSLGMTDAQLDDLFRLAETFP